MAPRSIKEASAWMPVLREGPTRMLILKGKACILGCLATQNNGLGLPVHRNVTRNAAECGPDPKFDLVLRKKLFCLGGLRFPRPENSSRVSFCQFSPARK